MGSIVGVVVAILVGLAVIAFARMTLTWLKGPFVNEAASKLIKALVKPFLEPQRIVVWTFPVHSKGTVAPQFTDDGRQRQSKKAQPSSPKANTAATAPSEGTTAVSNTGKQTLTGYTNRIGYDNGKNNGAINFGSSADLQKQKDVLKDLFGALNSNDDGKTQNGSPTTPPNNHPTSIPGSNPSSRILNNGGEQMLYGLTNRIGFSEGEGNGAINFD